RLPITHVGRNFGIPALTATVLGHLLAKKSKSRRAAMREVLKSVLEICSAEKKSLLRLCSLRGSGRSCQRSVKFSQHAESCQRQLWSRGVQNKIVGVIRKW